MKRKVLLFALGVLSALPMLARDFEYEYEGQTLTYTVISEEEKTCATKAGTNTGAPGNLVEGNLTIPSKVSDSKTTYTVISIGFCGFSGCSGLTFVSIPPTVTEIDNFAFHTCFGLISVSIPNSVTHIGHWAFKWCTALSSVTIPESVTSIGFWAFDDCSGLTKVYYGADKPITADDNVFSTDTYENATLYMSEVGAVMAGVIAPWNNFKKIEEYDVAGIEEITTDIDAARPYEVYNLNGVKLGNSLENLANGIYIVRQGSKTIKVAL